MCVCVCVLHIHSNGERNRGNSCAGGECSKHDVVAEALRQDSFKQKFGTDLYQVTDDDGNEVILYLLEERVIRKPGLWLRLISSP